MHNGIGFCFSLDKGHLSDFNCASTWAENIYFRIEIPIYDDKIVFPREPAIDFINEFYSAITKSVLFDIESSCNFFSDDCQIDLRRLNGTDFMFRFSIKFGRDEIFVDTISINEISDVFIKMMMVLVRELIYNIEYEELLTLLSPPILPRNKLYISKYFEQGK